jgi:hypothetical protein
MVFCAVWATRAALDSLFSDEVTAEEIPPSRDSCPCWVLASAAGAAKDSQATAAAPAMSTGRKWRRADHDNALLAMLDTPRSANTLTIFYSVCLLERQSPEPNG